MRRRLLFAIAIAVLLTTSPAGAHTGHTFTSTSTSSSTTWSVPFGSGGIDTVVIDTPAGWRFAHGNGTSELTPTAIDREQIGSGTIRARWVYLFCASTTQALDIAFETDLTGAPPGAVGHYVLSTFLGAMDMWVIEENDATDDYKLYMDLDDSLMCSSQAADSGLTITLQQQTASGGWVHQPPTASGCYTTTATFTDPSSGSHSGSASQAFGGGSCP